MNKLLLLVPFLLAAEPKQPEPSAPKEWCIEVKTTRPGKDGRVETVTQKVCGPLPAPSKEAPKEKAKQ